MFRKQLSLLPVSVLRYYYTINRWFVSFLGLDPLQSTPVPVSYTKYVTKHMSKIEMGEEALFSQKSSVLKRSNCQVRPTFCCLLKEFQRVSVEIGHIP